MSWTKRELISQAYEEIGLSSNAYTITPEQFLSGLRKLDGMMATWNNRGIRIAYPLKNSPTGSDIDEDSGVPDGTVEAIYLNLAIRLAPLIGRQVSRETKVSARQAYQAVITKMTQPKEMQLTDLPRGAGHKTWGDSDYRFLSPPTDPLEAGPDADLDFE